MDLINARENFKDLGNGTTALRVYTENDTGVDLGVALRFEQASSVILYLATGLFGALESEAKWKIQKIDITSGVSIKNASQDFDQIWDNRASLTYV
jgi:hypothetical protein